MKIDNKIKQKFAMKIDDVLANETSTLKHLECIKQARDELFEKKLDDNLKSHKKFMSHILK